MHFCLLSDKPAFWKSYRLPIDTQSIRYQHIHVFYWQDWQQTHPSKPTAGQIPVCDLTCSDVVVEFSTRSWTNRRTQNHDLNKPFFRYHLQMNYTLKTWERQEMLASERWLQPVATAATSNTTNTNFLHRTPSSYLSCFNLSESKCHEILNKQQKQHS